MNENTTDGENRSSKRRALALTGVGALVLLALLVALPAPAAAESVAQDNSTNTTIDDVAPYYPEHPTVDNASWTEGNENASADSIGTYLSRLGTFVIGSDSSSGGAMVTGMVLLGAMLGAVVRSRVGLIGGGVLTVASLWGVVGIGLAPEWVLGVTMFGVALVLSAAMRRILQ